MASQAEIYQTVYPETFHNEYVEVDMDGDGIFFVFYKALIVLQKGHYQAKKGPLKTKL